MASNPASGSALPTFLATDPFPSQRSGRPGSSAASDATSEYETATSRVPSLTGPVGEPGLPPSRPLSGSSFSTEYSQHRGGSGRTSLPVPPSRRSAGAAARKDASMAQSPSRVSQSHVPSLMAAGFTRPMSPQRLQAQRGQSTRISGIQARAGATSPDTFSGHARRESNASVKTLQSVLPDLGDAPPLPVSRGTAYTTSETTLPVGAASVVSKNSATPLNTQQTQSQSRTGAGGLSTAASGSQIAPRSNRSSLRASFGLGSSRRSSKREERRSPGPGHEKLPSGPTSPVMTANEKHAPATPVSESKPAVKNPHRNYEYFAGNMIFFARGRLLNTYAKPLNLVTLVITAIPIGMFFGFSAKWLWLNVSPALPIIFAYISLVCLSSFFHAAFSDPGILPRNLHPHPTNPEEERDPLTLGPAMTEWVMVKTFASRKPQSAASNAENGDGAAVSPVATAMEVPTKYCKSCNTWRPPRAHHCRICNSCIETQDHHCVWLNNCVGRRNYRFFFAYVGSASLLALALIAFSLAHVGLYARDNGLSFRAALTGRTDERVAFAMFIYALFALPYPSSLFVYHLFLISRGETTREYLNSHKFLPRDRHRPFAQAGLRANWAAVLARPRNPSYMDFAARYRPGDLRFGYARPKAELLAAERADAAALRARYGVSREKSAPALPAEAAGNAAAAGAETTATARSGASTELEMKQLPLSRGGGSPTAGPTSPVNRTPR